MNGLLVMNHFLKLESFDIMADMFEKSADRLGISLQRTTNARLWSFLGGDPVEAKERLDRSGVGFVLFWDKDVRLAQFLEGCGIRVFNSSSATEACDDKSLTYIKLLGKGINMPETLICPKVFYPDTEPYDGFIESAENILSYPIVVKECFGSLGEQVRLAHDRRELEENIKSAGAAPLILQKFISSSYGRDMRLYVVGGRVVASMIRRSENDFRANAAQGASVSAFDPTEKQIQTAVAACGALGLDHAGVDLLFGEDGEPLLCEVNSNAQFIHLDRAANCRIEDEILKHIISETA